MDSTALGNRLGSLPVRGLTLTGGEPLDQPSAVSAVLHAFPKDKDVLLYSGYTFSEICSSSELRKILLLVDAALLGRYDASKPHPYMGKELVIRTGRIRPEDLTPSFGTELIVGASDVVVTGFPSRNRMLADARTP
jgi:anaerobic ribonucleoside-triphosphate reductase activating protein